VAARSRTATLTTPAARSALAGLLYAVIGLAGLAAGDGTELAGSLRVSTGSSTLALLVGLAGLGAGAATPTSAHPGRSERRTSSARARSPAG
jgi:hypothetical protein